MSGPSWINGDNGNQIYILTATLPANTGKPDFELMLRAFLTEQFKLRVHHETKLFPGFELVLAPVPGAHGFPEMPPASRLWPTGTPWSNNWD